MSSPGRIAILRVLCGEVDAAIRSLPVTEFRLAAELAVPVEEIRNDLQILELTGRVTIVRNGDGAAATVTDKGKASLAECLSAPRKKTAKSTPV